MLAAREVRQADIIEDSQTNWRKSFKSFLRKGSAKISTELREQLLFLQAPCKLDLPKQGDSDLDRELTLSESEFTQVLQNSKHLGARPGSCSIFGSRIRGSETYSTRLSRTCPGDFASDRRSQLRTWISSWKPGLGYLKPLAPMRTATLVCRSSCAGLRLAGSFGERSLCFRKMPERGLDS